MIAKREYKCEIGESFILKQGCYCYSSRAYDPWQSWLVCQPNWNSYSCKFIDRCRKDFVPTKQQGAKPVRSKRCAEETFKVPEKHIYTLAEILGTPIRRKRGI